MQFLRFYTNKNLKSVESILKAHFKVLGIIRLKLL